MDIKGHAAIVTGGASGLGRATAQALAAAGAKVACLDQNGEGAEATARQISGTGIACDVTDADGIERAVATAREAHGPARILVNCAGIDTPGRIIARDGRAAPLEDFTRLVTVNLIGTFNMLRVVAADMKALEALDTGERGVIINTSSVVAFDGQVGHTAYAASKAGIAGMTLPAARELSRSGIRVLAIAPGLFDTPMILRIPEDARKTLGDVVPFPSRLGQPNEFASLALHLVENVMLNGEVVRLDGAVRLPPV